MTRRNLTDENNPYRVGQTNPETGVPICGAKVKNGTAKCMFLPVENGARCYQHGGTNIINLDGYGDGRYSKYLPSRLLEKYYEGMADPKLRELESELAIVDVRIKELTSRIDDGDSSEWWQQVDKYWKSYMTAVRTGNQKEQSKLLLLLDLAITEGRDESKTWRDITDLIDKRRKLVDTEQKRLSAAQQLISVDQATMMLSATIASLRDVIYLYVDQKTANNILAHAQKQYNKLISIDGSDGKDK